MSKAICSWCGNPVGARYFLVAGKFYHRLDKACFREEGPQTETVDKKDIALGEPVAFDEDAWE